MTGPDPPASPPLPFSAFEAFATQPATGSGGCGVAVPGAGELLIGSPFFVAPATLPFPGGTTAFWTPIPDDPSVVGAIVYTQGLFVDPSPTAVEPLRLSNAFSIRIGI